MKPTFLIALSLAATSARAQNTSQPSNVMKPTIVQSVVKAAGLQARIMWMDATANLDNLDTREKIADIMEKCRLAHINTVVLDVKPLIGEVLYPSKVAPRLVTYRGKSYDAKFDVLGVALEEGRKRGLKVYADVNVFSEGNKLVGRGLAYDKPDWQAITYVPDRTIVTDDGAYPVSPAVDDPPPAGGMAVYTQASGSWKPVKPNETYSVVTGGVVAATVSAAAAEGDGVPIPSDGFLLVGDGSAATWMADHLRAGQNVRWESRDALIPIVQAPTERVSAFVNPINPEPRAHELAVIKEIATNYDVDGVVFDRMRYASLATDFSDLSRAAFQKWAGVTLRNWPGDVYQYAADPTQEPIRGPYWKQWLQWRAQNLHDFAKEATQTVRAARPSAKCAVYVGSWYPVYYGVGVNWGSPEYNAAYDWMSETYHETGYAPLLDWLCTGTYYPDATRAAARALGHDEEATVEASAQMSNTVVADAAFVYASLGVSDYGTRTGAFLSAINAANDATQGVMLFDLVYVLQYNLWGALQTAFPTPAIAPHDVPDLLTRIAAVRQILPAATPPADTNAQNWKLVIKE